jgi:hypothetical protein
MVSKKLRVMLLNLENLFSPGVKFYGDSYSQQQYDAKIAWIGSMIHDAQAHVVGLTELGDDSQACIYAIMDKINALEDTDWPPFAHEFRAKPAAEDPQIRTPRGGTWAVEVYGIDGVILYSMK